MLVLESLEKAEVEVADELLGEALLLCVRYLLMWNVTPLRTLCGGWGPLVCPRDLACQPAPCAKCAMGEVLLRSCPARRMEEGPAPGLCTPACYLPTCPGLAPLRASSLLEPTLPPSSPTKAEP